VRAQDDDTGSAKRINRCSDEQKGKTPDTANSMRRRVSCVRMGYLQKQYVVTRL